MRISSKTFLISGIIIISCFTTSISASGLSFMLFFPQKDAYIDSSFPTLNFGSHKYLICGRVEGEGEKWIFIFFDFSSVPLGWEGVDLYLNFEEPTNLYSLFVDIYALNLSYWNEQRITWENRPDLGRRIISTSIQPLDEFTVPVDSFLFGPVLSVCLKVFTKNNAFMNFYSNEHDEVDLRPHLRFNYEDAGPQKLYGLIGIIISFGILGLTLSVIYSHYTNYLKMKEQK